MNFNKKLSICLNFTIGTLAFLGIFLALIFSGRDGYNPWYTRLLYFTQQSNIWIGVTCFVWGILLTSKESEYARAKYCVNLLKFIFTVSITLTGIIFCTLLAPFADFNVWTFSSVLTHVAVPLLSVADFLIQTDQPALKKRTFFYHLHRRLLTLFLQVRCVCLK